MVDRDAILLVPGLFGFESFGRGDARLVYFDRISDMLAGFTQMREERILVHRPPPTGPLSERVRSLHERVEQLLSDGIDGKPVERLHLIGHSTGGLDIRLLVNERFLWPGGPTGEERMAFLPRLGALVSVSAPHHGSPMSRRLRGAFEFLIPGLYLLSILAKHRDLGTREKVLVAYEVALNALTQQSFVKAALGLLADLPSDAAQEIEDFLTLILEDRRLIDDLAPLAMKRLNERISGGQRAELSQFVTVSPAPLRWGIVGSPLAYVRRAIYATSYWFARPTRNERRKFPDGTWITDGREHPIEKLARASASDSVVPSGFQVSSGTARGIVEGDHLDVVGHYRSKKWHGVTVFKSDAGFSDERFEKLWAEIARCVDEAREPRVRGNGSWARQENPLS